MKKSMIAAAVVFGLGVVGMTVSLPMAAKDAVGMYNDAVIGYSDDEIYEEYMTGGVTKVRVIDEYSWGQSVKVCQSPDDKVHFYVANTPLQEYLCEMNINNGEVEIVISPPIKKAISLDKKSIEELIRAEVNYNGNFILEVPENVTITNTKTDNIYFHVNGAKFENADDIVAYGYAPTDKDKREREEQNWLYEYQRAEEENEQLKEEIRQLEEMLTQQQEEMHISEIKKEQLEEYAEEVMEKADENTVKVEEVYEEEIMVTSSDILRLENELDEHQDMLRTGTIAPNVYKQVCDQLLEQQRELRVQQLKNADREDLIPHVLEIYGLTYEANNIEIEIISAGRDYDEGLITQEQYNGIVDTFGDSRRRLSKQLSESKIALIDKGYSWSGAVVL